MYVSLDFVVSFERSLFLFFLQAEIQTLTHQLKEVKQELSLEKKKNHLMVNSTSREDKTSTGSEVTGQLATMEMQMLNERQRAELAHVR